MPAITTLQQGPFGAAALVSHRPPRPGSKDDARVSASAATTGDRNTPHGQDQRTADREKTPLHQASASTISPATLFEASLLATTLRDAETQPRLPARGANKSWTPPSSLLPLRDRSV